MRGQAGLAPELGLAVTYDYELDEVYVTAALLGDANLDGAVDSDDFNLLAFNYDKSGTWADGDFDGDGVIGSDDFNVLAFNYGANAPFISLSDYAALEAFSATIAVPETGSLSLLGLASLPLVSRRRKFSRI